MNDEIELCMYTYMSIHVKSVVPRLQSHCKTIISVNVRQIDTIDVTIRVFKY